MATHNEFGTEGENLAVEWLRGKGYDIMHRNWRHSHYEIDIIAFKGQMLHFIEVKCRNHSAIGYPEDSVTKKKFRNLQKASDEFLFLTPGHPALAFLSSSNRGHKSLVFLPSLEDKMKHYL